MAAPDQRGAGAWDRDHPDAPAAPYAVNQIVHRSNDRLEDDMATCAKWKVPIVITSLGARAELNQAVHAWGGITLHDIINDRFARKAVEKGADGLIAVAPGAGGHAGRLSPFALVQEIREWFDGPLILSGAIATGRAILAAQAMGADLAYIGSPFIATEEANAAPRLQAGHLRGPRRRHRLFEPVHRRARQLSQEVDRARRTRPRQPSRRRHQDDGLRHRRGIKAKAWRDIWGSGQGIGAICEVLPARDYVARLIAEYAEAKAALCTS